MAVTILLVLMFSKYIYMTSLQNFYTFYLIKKFGVDIRSAQLFLFLFLGLDGDRHVSRRPDRRPDRAALRDLGLDPRRAAVHAGAGPMWGSSRQPS